MTKLTLIEGGGERDESGHLSPRCADLPPHDWCDGSPRADECGYAWTDVAGTHRCQLERGDGHDRHEDGVFWEYQGVRWQPAGPDPKADWNEEQIRASTAELRLLRQ